MLTFTLTRSVHGWAVDGILRKVVLNWKLPSLHLSLENVHLVEKEDDGDSTEPPTHNNAGMVISHHIHKHHTYLLFQIWSKRLSDSLRRF